MSEWGFLLDENVDPKTTRYLRKEGVDAEHVRDALWLGADDRSDILPYAREHELVIVTSDFRFADRLETGSVGVVVVYDDTMPAYRVTGGLLAMVDAYTGRDSFPGREVLDARV